MRTIGQQTVDRFMIVDESAITTDENGEEVVDMTADAYIVDLELGSVSTATPVGSILAHGHGTWQDTPKEGSEFPAASELLSSVGTRADELPEIDDRPEYRRSDVE